MKHVVTSQDGVQFVVQSDERTVAYDRAFAARQPAAVLAQHSDFAPVNGAQSVPSDTAIDLAVLIAPDPAPVRPRPQLRIIQGGKS
jgi:hypothetical protein